MRRTALALILAALLAVGARAQAQDHASHRVSVTIPTVLRLRLDEGARRDIADVELTVDVENGNAAVRPEASVLHLLANSAWTLHVSFAGDPGLGLRARLDGAASCPLTSGDCVLVSGGNTGGWQAHRVDYLAPDHLIALPDGRYGGTVTYTLTHP